MIKDKNLKTYSTSDVVNYYQYLQQLQPAEETIIKLLKNELPTMRMLDLGVGGGRTTKHFFPLVKEYIGVDYSVDMIEASKERLSQSYPSLKLRVGDARNLSQFEDNSCDFILFSFNGLDYISHEDRLKALQEISRVGKSGGYFFFSSHHLHAIEKVFNWQHHLSLNPFKTYVNLIMFAFLRGFNASISYETIQQNNYAILRDESHNFRLRTYYIRPSEQIKQLQPLFKDIKVYSWKTGLELTTDNDMMSCSDMWLYYLCRIK
ncbi:class I SAM-dependent methyltransferase [Cyanothece sp. BG0011]|uniref:class I SAM-dependent methyltransferase n=1 Tax=Cyanothece sp. BG0011 TaxID=2082950 RepID=UPI000D1F277F|nr:class I SAM-dependent methyltransferase [Cyanothece sp. BG0011]